MTGPTTKAQLRARLRGQRPERHAHHDPRRLAARVLELPEIAAATTLAVYESYGVEPATGPLLAELSADPDRTLLIPVLCADRDLDWRAFGTDAPLGREAIKTADVVIVPALAVDAAGHRLGQGGGSYDRALARVASGTPIVALLHDGELLNAGALAADPWDVPVTVVVTDQAIVRIAS